MRKSKNVRLIKPVNRLKKKAILDGPLAVNEETLERAEQAVAEIAGEYIGIVGQDLIGLHDAIGDLVESAGDKSGQLNNIFKLSHVIKGMGSTFDYDLITDIANSLCRFIESLGATAKPGSKVIMELHYDGLHAVLSEEMKGDGGPRGKELLNGTLSVVAKFHEAGSA